MAKKKAKKPAKKLEVNLKTINELIDKRMARMSSFKEKVSDAVAQDIELRLGHLRNAKKEVKSACKNAKMTPGFSSN